MLSCNHLFLQQGLLVSSQSKLSSGTIQTGIYERKSPICQSLPRSSPYALVHARFISSRAKPSRQSSKKSNSFAEQKKRWRQGPPKAEGTNERLKSAGCSPKRSTSASSPRPSQKRSSKPFKKDKTSATAALKGVSPTEPKIRPHILRDRSRIAAVRHQIRKVTGVEEPSAEPGKYNAQFAKLRLMGPLLRAIDELGWSSPTPIQTGTIALGIRGLNIVASAETGTGKTGAYALPMIQRIYVRKKYEESRGIERVAAPLGVVLCPTRELAEQVEEHLYELAKFIKDFRIVGLSGAFKDPEVQIRELKKGVDILVATPGRLLRLLNEKVENEDLLEEGALPTLEARESEDMGMFEDEELGLVDEAVENGEEEAFDDEFGADLEEEDVESLDDASALSKLTSTRTKETKKRREKRDAVYARWDRAWNDMEKLQKGGKERFKERLPYIAPGQAVKNANIDLTHVRSLALDEVDRMLAMGMFPEVRHLFKAMPRPQGHRDPERMQVFMFSATLVPRVAELVKRFAPHHARVDLNRAMNVADRVQQHFYQVGPRRKHALLTYLLRRKGSMKGQQVLVFCRTRQRVERLAAQLVEERFLASGIHGDQTLSQRQRIIDDFKDGKTQILVSTELMARGMDIPLLPFVVNYDLPHSPEEYVHRIGRTARAGNTGTAFSFISTEPTLLEVGKRLVELDEQQYLKSIASFLQKKLYLSKVPGPWKDESKKADSDSPNASSAPATTKRPSKQSKGKQYSQKTTETLHNTPILDTRTNEIVNARALQPKNATKYTYLEQDKELTSIIPPERNVVDKAHRVLSRLYDKKTRQVEQAAKTGPLSHISDADSALKSQVSLRDFKEGRYEDVMNEFDTRRARRLGVVVPTDLDRRIKKKRAQVAKVYQQKLVSRQKSSL